MNKENLFNKTVLVYNIGKSERRRQYQNFNSLKFKRFYSDKFHINLLYRKRKSQFIS